MFRVEDFSFSLYLKGYISAILLIVIIQEYVKLVGKIVHQIPNQQVLQKKFMDRMICVLNALIHP